jgi:hypothetical protein
MDTCRRCGAALSPEISWCGQCFARLDQQPISAPSERAVSVVAQGAPGLLGDRSHLGVAMRTLLTLLAIAVGFAIIAWFAPWWEAGRAIWALGTVLIVIYSSLASLFVAKLWLPAEFRANEERIVLVDPDAAQEVQRRQSAMVRREPDSART